MISDCKQDACTTKNAAELTATLALFHNDLGSWFGEQFLG